MMGLLTLVMLFAGVAKLAGNEDLWQQFVAFGYPRWFFMVTGIIEVAGAALLWPRNTRLIGAALIAATMIGALVSNFRVGAREFYLLNLGLGAMAGAVGWINRPVRRR